MDGILGEPLFVGCFMQGCERGEAASVSRQRAPAVGGRLRLLRYDPGQVVAVAVGMAFQESLPCSGLGRPPRKAAMEGDGVSGPLGSNKDRSQGSVDPLPGRGAEFCPSLPVRTTLTSQCIPRESADLVRTF